MLYKVFAGGNALTSKCATFVIRVLFNQEVSKTCEYFKVSTLCSVINRIHFFMMSLESFYMGSAGLNTGVQDAHNLAWKLAAVLKDHASESLLSTYEVERQPVT